MVAPALPALYGHPFSSFTWKALIALYASGIAFDFRALGETQPEYQAFVQQAGPAGKFPVLDDNGTVIVEATAIIEHLAAFHPAAGTLIPADPARAVQTRMLDRILDNYVMAPMQAIVAAWIECPAGPTPARTEPARIALRRSYAWLDPRIPARLPDDPVTLLECAAAPALFYADWVEPIGADCPRLAAWRAQLLALPAIKRCVDEARPFRGWFPPGAPDRD